MQIEDLKTQFKGFTDRIDAMSLRERGLIFVTLLAVLYFVAVNVLFGPVNAEKDRLQKQVNQLHEETRLLEIQVQGLVSGSENDPDAVKRKKIVSLQENLKTMDAALNRVTAGLVPPKEMTKLIDIFSKIPEGKSITVSNTPPSALAITGLPAAIASTGTNPKSS